jgi:hypothetical protein
MAAAIADPQQTSAPAPTGGANARSPFANVSFLDVLSTLNPLQYLPVVGTIYRAVTGNTIPEPIRMVGSLVASGLMGGPIGVVTNIATTIAEKATGIDPERIGRSVLASLGSTLGLTHATDSNSSTQQITIPTTASFTTMLAAAPTRSGWTRAELAAYGVSTSSDGSLHQGNLEGAEVLNAMELSRLQVANAAYARAMHARSPAPSHV